MDDADLDWAVDTLMDGAMFNSGQCCCGIERIYVHARLYDAFVEKAVAWVKGLKLGNPLDPETTIGPMANALCGKTVRARSQEAIADGAVALIDPTPSRPTMAAPISDAADPRRCHHHMRVMRDESFGPVVGIMKVTRTTRRRIALMNDCQFGLTASLWTAMPAGGHRRPDRNRHRVHEPLRLSRPGAVLDRLQGHRPRRRAVHYRLPQRSPGRNPITSKSSIMSPD
jgi:acyl-CoA reductase-like NAD-dependent aldehyde dehydrogenase